MNAAPELVPAVLKMMAALAMVVGGLFVMVHFTRRYRRPAGRTVRRQMMRVVASQAIGAKKSVTLVDVPDCVLVLGVSPDRIQLLSRIEDPETLSRVRAYEGAAGGSFHDQLARLLARRRADGHDD